jgi:hypothetical protein
MTKIHIHSAYNMHEADPVLPPWHYMEVGCILILTSSILKIYVARVSGSLENAPLQHSAHIIFYHQKTIPTISACKYSYE